MPATFRIAEAAALLELTGLGPLAALLDGGTTVKTDADGTLTLTRGDVEAVLTPAG